jgi:hypothetical protein
MENPLEFIKETSEENNEKKENDDIYEYSDS